MKKSKIILLHIFAVVLLFVLTACRNPHSTLVGVWDLYMGEYCKFGENGEFIYCFSDDTKDNAEGLTYSVLQGSYKLSTNKLQFSENDYINEFDQIEIEISGKTYYVPYKFYDENTLELYIPDEEDIYEISTFQSLTRCTEPIEEIKFDIKNIDERLFNEWSTADGIELSFDNQGNINLKGVTTEFYIYTGSNDQIDFSGLYRSKEPGLITGRIVGIDEFEFSYEFTADENLVITSSSGDELLFYSNQTHPKQYVLGKWYCEEYFLKYQDAGTITFNDDHSFEFKGVYVDTSGLYEIDENKLIIDLQRDRYELTYSLIDQNNIQFEYKDKYGNSQTRIFERRM